MEAIAARLEADILLVNATSFTQTGLIHIPGDPFQRFTRDGSLLPVQPAESGLWVDAGQTAPYSVIGLKKAAGNSQASVHQPPDSLFLENSFLRVEFNAAGDITHIFDRQARREVLAPNAVANQFQAFEDRPGPALA